MTFCDIDPGRWIDVPAIQFCLKWEEAQPKNLHSRPFELLFLLHCCRNLDLLWSFTIGLAASEPSSEQGRRKYLPDTILFT